LTSGDLVLYNWAIETAMLIEVGAIEIDKVKDEYLLQVLIEFLEIHYCKVVVRALERELTEKEKKRIACNFRYEEGKRLQKKKVEETLKSTNVKSIIQDSLS